MTRSIQSPPGCNVRPLQVSLNMFSGHHELDKIQSELCVWRGGGGGGGDGGGGETSR